MNLEVVHAKSLQLCLTLSDPVDCSRQAPLSMGFSRQEHWSGSPCPPPGDHPNPRIEPTSQVSCIGRHVLYHSRRLHYMCPDSKFNIQEGRLGYSLLHQAFNNLGFATIATVRHGSFSCSPQSVADNTENLSRKGSMGQIDSSPYLEWMQKYSQRYVSERIS